MYLYNIAYRHHDNTVEGFSGFAFASRENARQQAIDAIKQKCAAIVDCGIAAGAFDASRIIEKKDGLTAAEIVRIEADWKIEERKGPGRS